jgi:hypothetical protein
MTEFNDNDAKDSPKSSSNRVEMSETENKNKKGLRAIDELLEKSIAISCSIKDMVKNIRVEEKKETSHPETVQKVTNVQRISNRNESQKRGGGIGFGL